MPSSNPVVIVGAARTPMGGLQGDFASLGAPQLGSAAIRAAPCPSSNARPCPRISRRAAGLFSSHCTVRAMSESEILSASPSEMPMPASAKAEADVT